MTRTVFRISVIDGALCICERRAQYGDLSIERIVRQLKSGPSDVAGYDYDAAIKLGSEVGWDAFCVEGSREHRFRETLRVLLQRITPFWAQASFRGRRRVIEALSVDQIQCFEVAGLLSPAATDDVVAWWDQVGQFFRGLHYDRTAEIGRTGERLTLEHEQRKLIKEGIDKCPVWVSFDDEGMGYDVLSYRREYDGSISEVQIEVKASRYSPMSIFVTRPQWDHAVKHPDSHIFHVWDLNSRTLREISVHEMSLNIPADHGEGEWQSVRVLVRE